VDYDRDALDETSVAHDPFAQFSRWLEEALATEGLIEPYAMTVATVDAEAKPDARVVLLRGFDQRGFTFFTNYASRKGTELAAHPFAALLFFWAPLQRQIRIEGRVTKLDAGESDAYFARRPRGHRLSAWASPQSAPVDGRATLEKAMAEAEERFAGVEVPRPEHWGGYRVAGDRFEFWQGRRNRVHDRLAYVKVPSVPAADPGMQDQWRILRLAP